MNPKLISYIEDIFVDLPRSPHLDDIRKMILKRTNISYNQILNSGFSEYIAYAECKDSLAKAIELISAGDYDYDHIADSLDTPDQILARSIKATTMRLQKEYMNFNQLGDDNLDN